MKYLIITYIKKPNGEVDESVEVESKYRSRHKTTANVVLDFEKKEILKCRMDGHAGSRDWKRVRDYYHKYYQNVVEDLEQQQQENYL
jgi:hypothetical protein